MKNNNYIIFNNKNSHDKRGSFVKPFNQDNFKEIGISCTFKECLYTISHKDVIRGMHYQEGCSKLLWVSSGVIQDVALCINKNSEDFGKYFSVILSSNNYKSLYLSPDYAHGFIALSDAVIVNYLLDQTYGIRKDKGFRYDSFDYDWDIENPIVSEKDLSLSLFKKENF